MSRKYAVCLMGLVLVISFSGCATMSLWAPEDKKVIDRDGKWRYEEIEDPADYYDSDAKVWQKILYTPFTLLIDAVTAPIQGFFLDPRWGSEERSGGC